MELVLSRVNGGLESIEDLVRGPHIEASTIGPFCWRSLVLLGGALLITVLVDVCVQITGDEEDEGVLQMNLHGNLLQSLDGLDAFTS